MKPSIICNLCGGSCLCEHGNMLGLIDWAIDGGYESTPGNGCGALDDTTRYTFSLCEFCIDWLFLQFKTPPKVNRYSLANGPDGDIVHRAAEQETFRPAEQRVLEDAWRARGREAFLAKFKKRNAARGPR